MRIIGTIQSVFESLKEVFLGLERIDRNLLVVLGVSLIAKFIKELVGVLAKKPRGFYKKGNQGPCYFISKINGSGETNCYSCSNYLRSALFRKNGKCPRDGCRGYYPVDMIEKSPRVIENSLFFGVLFLCLDWVANLSSVLLIVRTILEVSIK